MTLACIEPEWPASSRIKAFTTTRTGGGSMAPYDGLNLAEHVGDDLEDVRHNRKVLSEHLALPQTPQWLNQQHTLDIQTDTVCFGGRPCDGSYTQQAGRVCVVMTADCMPIFITDTAGTQVSVVHAGWRGLAGGIVEKAIQLFTAPVQELLVWAGPTISQANFEIGAEVKQALGGSDRFYQANANKPGHYFADLYGLAGERMAALGVSFYGHSSLCTYADEERLFSYRRAAVTGRMASLIWMEM